MSDLCTMMWKEIAEFFGNRKSLRIFVIMVLVMGIVPTLVLLKERGQVTINHSAFGVIFLVIYVLFATAVVVAQTAPDMVLHERIGHTLDYLLTTRLPDEAIFGAKVLVSSALGYVAAMLALAIQLVAAALFSGSGWQWLFLSLPIGRIMAFGISADLSLYVAVVGTFVALRVGEQRAAYMITIGAVVILMVPFLLGWLHLSLTIGWVTRATIVFGAVAIALGLIGLRLFRRDRLALYLQE